jgi:hypothetical protein
MSNLDVVQIGLSVASMLIQVCAFVYALPLKDYLSRRFWLFIVALTVCEIARRALTLSVVAGLLAHDRYETSVVVIGLLVSVVMLVVVMRLRKHAKRSKMLADATLELGKTHHAEESLAYKLALHFIEQTHAKDHR